MYRGNERAAEDWEGVGAGEGKVGKEMSGGGNRKGCCASWHGRVCVCVCVCSPPTSFFFFGTGTSGLSLLHPAGCTLFQGSEGLGLLVLG